MELLRPSHVSRTSWVSLCTIAFVVLSVAPTRHQNTVGAAFVTHSQSRASFHSFTSIVPTTPKHQNTAAAFIKPHSHAVARPYSSSTTILMGRRGRGKVEKKPLKANLPEKVCVVCGRPFTWRKKWEKCWDEVTCCSKSCNAKRRAARQNVSKEIETENV